jgi:transcriptional regulator with XRE-family HTH domain
MELNSEDEKVTPRTLLGKRLRRERGEADLSLRALAEQLGYPHPYISRVEQGKQLPSADLATALDVFFRTKGMFTDLLEMARDAVIPDYNRRAINLETEAGRIQVFASSLIPGLLQTKDYARELFRGSLPGESEERLEEHVAVRMHRQSIFDQKEPPFFWAIMDEAALRRPVGGAPCMAEQLRHLLKASEQPCTEVRVLPFDEGTHPMMGGCLTLLTLHDGGTMAFVESFASGEQVEAPTRVLDLTQRFDVARSMALSGDKSWELIGQHLKGYEDESNS